MAKKVTTFCNGLSQVMKPGFITINQKQSRKACNGTIRLSSLVAKKFRLQPLADKLMLTMFWDSQGPILETNMEQLSQVQPIVTCFRED
jgi:hypothetical protein